MIQLHFDRTEQSRGAFALIRMPLRDLLDRVVPSFGRFPVYDVCVEHESYAAAVAGICW